MRWRAFGILTIACVLAMTLAATPAAAVWMGWMSFTRIGHDGIGDTVPESWYSADVQGDWVVSQRSVDSALNWNVDAYNLKTRATRTVSAAAGGQTHPRVWGRWVVFQDTRWGDSEIYAFDLATSTEKRLTNRPGAQQAPDISGTKVVYLDAAAGDIYLYDLATNTDTVLPLGPGSQGSASISGNRVVYAESGDIFVYDMSTGNIARLTSDAVGDSSPDIDGTLVAWQRGGMPSDIWTQDLAGGAAAAAVATGDSELMPRVSGTLVTFFRQTGGNYNVGIYDSILRDWEMVATSATDDVLPAIDGINLVYTEGWMAYGAFGGSIALGRLIAPELSAKAASSIVPYGKKTTISGSLVENGIALGSLPIAIDRSTNGGHTWSQVAALSTSPAGGYSFTTPALYAKAMYRARYNGRLYFAGLIDHFSALSPAVPVTARAAVARPTGYPKTGRKTRTYSVYGSLKPRQAAAAAAAKVVVVKCYRRQSGTYVLRRTFSARVYDYSTFSRYRASVKLPYKGTWRLRAYFKGSASHAAQNSTYRYVRVK